MPKLTYILLFLVVGIVAIAPAHAWTERTTGPDAKVLVLEKGRSTVIESSRTLVIFPTGGGSSPAACAASHAARYAPA